MNGVFSVDKIFCRSVSLEVFVDLDECLLILVWFEIWEWVERFFGNIDIEDKEFNEMLCELGG